MSARLVERQRARLVAELRRLLVGDGEASPNVVVLLERARLADVEKLRGVITALRRAPSWLVPGGRRRRR